MMPKILRRSAFFLVFTFELLFQTLNGQTYYSKVYDIGSCNNGGVAIGLIEEGVIQVVGYMFCGVPDFHGNGNFSIDLFDGQLLNAHTEDRFNTAGQLAICIEDGYFIGGTGSFVPEKGIWKVDRYGTVLDSFLYNHPDPFVYTRSLFKIGPYYYATLVHASASKFDLLQLDLNLDMVNFYPEFVQAEPGDDPEEFFSGPDGSLHFTVCQDNTTGVCENLQVFRFDPGLNHELVYETPEDERDKDRFHGEALPADDSTFFYLWNKDTFRLFDSTNMIYHNNPGIVSRVNYAGERLWDAYFWEFNAYTYKAFTAQNGDLIILGEHDHHYDYQPGTIPDRIIGGGYAARVSSQGEILWQRKILDTLHCYNDDGQGCYSTFYNGAELPNGDLVFTGRIDSIIPGAPPNINTNPNTWVVKTDADGCLEPGCGLLQFVDTVLYTAVQEPRPQRRPAVTLSVSPNPVAGGAVTIDLSGEEQGKRGTLLLFDAYGRRMQQWPDRSLPLEIGVDRLIGGIYHLRWQPATAGQRAATGRLVVY